MNPSSPSETVDAAPPLRDAVFVQLQQELRAFMRRRVPNEAEELAQDVWVRVAKARPTFAQSSELRAYVFAVARAALVDHYRRRRARVSLVPASDDLERLARSDPSADAADARARRGDVLRVLEQAVAELPAPTAEVVRLRMTEDVTFAQIAARQGVPLSTALGRMHRGMIAVRAALERAGLLDGEIR